jgi:hypothetical protein
VIASVAETDADNLKFLPICNDSLIMGFALICAGGAATGFWGWRLSVTPRARRFRGDGSFTYVSGCDPLTGIAFRGLSAAEGSQFLQVPSEGTSHAAAGSVRVLGPGESRAIHWQWSSHGGRSAMPNVGVLWILETT